MNTDISDNQRLKSVRKMLGLSQEDMARKLDYKQGSYSDIERGRVLVNYRVLKGLYIVFGVNPLYIMFEKEPVFIDESYKFQSASKLKSNHSEKVDSDGNLNGNLYGNLIPETQRNSTYFQTGAQEAQAAYKSGQESAAKEAIPVIYQGEINSLIQGIDSGQPYGASSFISLDALRISSKDHCTFQIEGDVMRPTIKNMDYTVCQAVTDAKYCRKGEVYLVIIPQGAICMRLRADWNGTGNMPLSGDNPEAGDLDIRAQDILQLWRARAVLSLDLSPLKGLFKSQFTASELAQLREAFKDL